MRTPFPHDLDLAVHLESQGEPMDVRRELHTITLLSHG